MPLRWWFYGQSVVPLSLGDYPDVENASPFEQDEAIVTVEATGGSAPYSYAITAQSTTASLQVTGTLNPDATGIYTENGTYNGEPAYERADGAYWIWYDGDPTFPWFLSGTKGAPGTVSWVTFESALLGAYSASGIDATGTATVALYAPFAINSNTGAITIADPSGLAVGQTWTITVQVTDAASATDTGTVTVELVSGAVFVRRINQRFLATGSYGAAQVQV